MRRCGVEGMAGVKEWKGEDITPVCDMNGQVCFVTTTKRTWQNRCNSCGLVVCFPSKADNYCAVCFRTARRQQHGWICCGRPCWEVYQQHRQQQREASGGQGSGGVYMTTTTTQQPMPPPPPPPAPHKAQPPQQPPQQQLQQQQSPPMDTDTFIRMGASIKQAIESSKIPHLQSMKSLKLESFQSFKFEKQ